MTRSRIATIIACVTALLGIARFLVVRSTALAAQDDPTALKPVSAFARISDRHARSAALFVEAGKVIQSPRCLNCHPPDRRPTQGDDLHPHVPPMIAGESGSGLDGYPCQTCHGPSTVRTLGQELKSIPGDPRWSLAPLEMAWQGKSLRQICEQIKDLRRNGGKTLPELHEHMARDHLVGSAWRLGEGRRPAPGTQEQFGELIQAWIESGAACPPS